MRLYLCIGKHKGKRKAKHNHLNYTSALLREYDRTELKVKKLGDLELKNAHYHKLFYQIEFRDPLP